MLNRNNRAAFAIALFLSSVMAILPAEEPSSSVALKPSLPSEWTVSAGGWEKGKLGGNFPLSYQGERPSGSEGITLSGSFSLPQGWKGPLGIMLYKNNMSCIVYVNDTRLDVLGQPGPRFFFQPYISRGVLVPEKLLSERNSIRLELWNDTGAYKIRLMDFMGEGEYRSKAALYDFLDVQLPRYASVLLWFVALYSLFQFINYRKKKESFYLAFGSLFFGIYLLNVTIAESAVPYLLLKSLLYACFPVSMLFLFHFFRTYFGLSTGKRGKWAINIAGAVFAAGYFLQRDTAALDTWHSVMLLYPVSALAYAFYGAFKRIRTRAKDMLPILVGLVIAVLFSGYDIVNFVGGLTPFILLQGIGVMCMIFGNFYSFSQEIADTNLKCSLFAEEMGKSKEQRDEIFRRITADAGTSEEIGSRLDESIERVGSLVSQYLASADQINASIGTQNLQVQQNKESVERIFSALQETSEMVGRHERLVEVTVRNVGELTEGIHRTDELVKATGSTIGRLTEVCIAADREVAESSRFVNDLAQYSSNINQIVKAISDVAEQTNILSINAAIEAARYGQTGKGFAVVAGEIRTLAERSAKSASEINTIIATMVSMIQNIQKQEALVSGRLKDVIGENRNMEKAIGEVFTVLEAQLSRNERISEAVGDLVAAVKGIAEKTAAEKADGESLRASLLLLEKASQAILVSSNEQRQCNEELKDNLSLLRKVSENNLEVNTDLKKLVR